jgi:hypothetical protein
MFHVRTLTRFKGTATNEQCLFYGLGLVPIHLDRN